MTWPAVAPNALRWGPKEPSEAGRSRKMDLPGVRVPALGVGSLKLIVGSWELGVYFFGIGLAGGIFSSFVFIAWNLAVLCTPPCARATSACSARIRSPGAG